MNCSHIVAVYFSPTHTSRRIAREVARGTGLGLLAEIDLTCEAGCDPIALPKDALILLAAPVYGGRVSPTALERLARLRGQGQAQSRWWYMAIGTTRMRCWSSPTGRKTGA